MILGLYSRNDALLDSARLVSMLDRMEKASCKLRRVAETADLQGIDMLLSIGGDGTFLSVVYLMPLPLYGSGGRFSRTSAANWPAHSGDQPRKAWLPFRIQSRRSV